MGLFDKFDKAMDSARKVVREVQDSATSAKGQAERTVTGQASGPLPSNEGDIDVFAPLLAAANDIGYPYVARSESIDGVGWTLHSNRLGLDVNERDLQTGGVRVTVEALNRPMASLADWELAKGVLSQGEDEERVYVGSEQVRFLTHQLGDGAESSFLRRRLVVRVRVEGPGATERLARDFAGNVCWNYLDLDAVQYWAGQYGVDVDVDINTEPLAGHLTVQPGPAVAAPEQLDLVIPDAAATCSAIVPPGGDRVFLDWDEFGPGADLIGFAPVSRAFVRLEGWGGVVFRGEHGEFAQVIAVDAPDAVREPGRYAALLLEPQTVPGEFEGNTIAIGLDPYGYPSAAVTIGDIAFLARLSGPAGHQGGRELVHRFAVAAINAMPG